MKKILVLLVVLALAALLVFGCTNSNQYPTGNVAYGQQGQQQPYVGGGCGVAPASDIGEPLQVSDKSLAA